MKGSGGRCLCEEKERKERDWREGGTGGRGGREGGRLGDGQASFRKKIDRLGKETQLVQLKGERRRE